LANDENPNSSREKELLLYLYRDAVDSFRQFRLIEEFLVAPQLLERQRLFQVAPKVQRYLLWKYYDFEDKVIRELVGRKLNPRARKDLDEVAETTSTLLHSCQRQFDNLRRIFNALDERNFEGNITHTITEQFLVPWALAERYTCILFLLYNRFQIQSGRKRTSFLDLSDLEFCTALIIAHWLSDTVSTGTRRFDGTQYLELTSPQFSSGNFERAANVVSEGFVQIQGNEEEDFAEENEEEEEEDAEDDEEDDQNNNNSQQDSAQQQEPGILSNLPKSLVLRQRLTTLPKEIKFRPGNTSMDISPDLIASWRLIKGKFTVARSPMDSTVEKALSHLEEEIGTLSCKKLRHKARYKTWAKSLMTIAGGLGQAKELRDLFEDVSVLLCEPIYFHIGLTGEHLQQFLLVTERVFGNVILAMKRKGLLAAWESFMSVASLMISRIYGALERIEKS